MGVVWNIRQGLRLHAALLPLANASDEATFRALLPAAEALGAEVWGGGKRLVREGSAKHTVLTAATGPQVAAQLLQVGEFYRAKALIQQCVSDLQNLYN